MGEEFARLRDEIANLDRGLLELMERRFQLAAEVGRIKAERGQPVVVREVEQRVLSRARERATACGVTPDVMESIFSAIIRGSVERQHRVGVSLRASGGRQLLVIGGAGAMGSWMIRFLEGIGHRVEAVDTAWSSLPPRAGRYGALADVPDPERFDGILVAVSLGASASVLDRLADLAIPTPVVEIASIKSQLEDSLARLRAAGTPVVSLHPMFGPGKNPYEPLTFVHAVLEDEEEETRRILEIFRHPYLDLVSLPFKRHDRLMGWILGLAHLCGMLFAGALTRSKLDPEELGRVASTTFARQVDTSRSVLGEDPALYFAIQRLNPHRGEVYAALTAAIGELTGAVESEDREVFTTLLERAAGSLPPPGVDHS